MTSETEFLDRWIREEVSKPSPETSNIPACPYALKAWVENRVHVVNTADMWESVSEEINKFDDSFSVVICSQPSVRSYEELEGCCMGLNAYLSSIQKDIWLLSFQDEYDMILIQRLSHLDDASQYLERMGYYKDYGRDDFERLVATRRRWRQKCQDQKE